MKIICLLTSSTIAMVLPDLKETNSTDTIDQAWGDQFYNYLVGNDDVQPLSVPKYRSQDYLSSDSWDDSVENSSNVQLSTNSEEENKEDYGYDDEIAFYMDPELQHESELFNYNEKSTDSVPITKSYPEYVEITTSKPTKVGITQAAFQFYHPPTQQRVVPDEWNTVEDDAVDLSSLPYEERKSRRALLRARSKRKYQQEISTAIPAPRANPASLYEPDVYY